MSTAISAMYQQSRHFYNTIGDNPNFRLYFNPYKGIKSIKSISDRRKFYYSHRLAETQIVPASCHDPARACNPG